MVKARKWTLAKRLEGVPKTEDFKIVEEELPALKDGEVLVENLFVSVDPYQRGFAELNLKPGDTMVGSTIGKITESKDKDHPVGSHVVLYTGWRDKSVVNAQTKRAPGGLPILTKCPELDVSKSSFLGVLGMPGFTAYFGCLRILEPKEGEVFLVNAAAGAVGSAVGQIAKLKGCKVIGYAGTDDKVKWLKQVGFDYAYNYKTADLNQTLKEAAPDGIDCYFDNVGGSFTSTVLAKHMKNMGRVSVCGAISQYNDLGTEKYEKGPYPPAAIIYKNLKVEGFLVSRWSNESETAFKDLYGWIKQGKLKYQEKVTNGFEKTPQAFIELFTGANTGKAVVKI